MQNSSCTHKKKTERLLYHALRSAAQSIIAWFFYHSIKLLQSLIPDSRTSLNISASVDYPLSYPYSWYANKIYPTPTLLLEHMVEAV